MGFSRRDALKLGGLAAVGVAGVGLPLSNSLVNASTASQLPASKMPKPYQVKFNRLGVLEPKSGANKWGEAADLYDLTAKPGTAAIVPGMLTPVLGYEGRVPARQIKCRQGRPVQMTMRNQLPAKHPTFGTPMNISTHLHGSASLPQYDGYADDVTKPGQKKVYQYPNFQPARTLWYHDHGVHYTAQNAYSGLASQYHLHDEQEQDLLPQGDYDVALTVSDIQFRANGSQMYDDRSGSGLWGDVILVNGQPWPAMQVKRRIYRFRFLVASISRSYRFSLSNKAPMHVVATDGGLMPKSRPVTEFRQGSAERYEVLIDFRNYKAGTQIFLNNLSNANNRDYDNTGKVMRFDVVDDGDLPPDSAGSKTISGIPDALNPGLDVMNLTEKAGMKINRIAVERGGGIWNLSGRKWHDVEARDFSYKEVLASPDLGETQVWEIENRSGGWYHPVHIHLVDFQILSRNGKAPFEWEKGPKDVVYIGEGEKVRLIMKFEHHRGRYMVHCHNLVHEDSDMMHQFAVGLNNADEKVNIAEDKKNDPINADPAVADK
jgi:FtsP/CotA-like multicopper oxidase with cupredoxin domain